MDLSLNIDEATLGMEVFFFVRPKDSVPTARTTIQAIDEDERGRPVVLGKGIEGWMPPFHFRKANPKIESYGCAVTNPLDDLHARTGN